MGMFVKIATMSIDIVCCRLPMHKMFVCCGLTSLNKYYIKLILFFLVIISSFATSLVCGHESISTP